MNVFKKSNSALTATIGAVVAVISMVLFLILSTDGENTSEANFVAVLLGVGIVIQVISLLLYGVLKRTSLVLTVLGLVQTACYALALMLFIIARINWLFMLLSKMSSTAMTALFPATIIVMVLTLLIQVISTFMSYEKK